MKNLLLLIFPVFCIISIVGCTTNTVSGNRMQSYRPTETEIENADYGTYPENWEEIIKDFMATILKDPYSAQYRFKKEPIKSFESGKDLASTKFYYLVLAMINAKNSYGGYVGEVLFVFHIRNGKVIDYVKMDGLKLF